MTASEQAAGGGARGGRWLRLLLWSVVALAAVVGLRQALDGEEVVGAIQDADRGWIALAALTILGTQVAKGVRWRSLLRAQGIHAPLGELIRVQLIGQGLNTFLPVRVGEIARLQWLKRFDRALVLSTITIEKSADLLCFGVMGAALTFGATLPGWLSDRFRFFAMSATTGIALVALVLLLSREAWLRSLSEKSTLLRRLIEPYLRFRRGWRMVTQPRDALVLLGESVCVWGMAAATNVCLLAAFGAAPSWEIGAVLLVVLQIGITVVTLPATIGIFEYLCVLTLGWFGIPQPVAFGIGVVLHLLVLLPNALGVWFSRPRFTANVRI